MKTSFRAYMSVRWRPIRVVIPGFIRNPQAVLLLAACPTPKSDRLLDRLTPGEFTGDRVDESS